MKFFGAVRSAFAVTGVAAAAQGLASGAYLTAIGAAASRQLQKGHRASSKSRRGFRILIPAHNEESGLGATLESLSALDYPAELVEIHVVADNCTDATAVLARSLGATAHERVDPANPGKGAALAWLIDRLPPSDDHIIVVIDADTIVVPALLREFDAGFEHSVAAIQGHYVVRDAESGSDVGFRSIALAVRHLVRPAGRTAFGGSSSLYGNGMAFREHIARKYRWSNSLTEDLEMGLRLLLDGHQVGFAAGAEVAAEMPTSLDSAESQNERWEAGRLEVARTHVPVLMRAARTRAHGRRWAYVDAAIDIALPPMTLLAASTATGGVLTFVFARGRVRRLGTGAATIGLGMQVVHVLHSLRLADAPAEVRRSLLRTPAHILWKSRLVVRVARRKPESWIKTTRNLPKEAA